MLAGVEGEPIVCVCSYREQVVHVGTTSFAFFFLSLEIKISRKKGGKADLHVCSLPPNTFMAGGVCMYVRTYTETRTHDLL